MQNAVDGMDFLSNHNAKAWLIRPAGHRFGDELWQPVLARPLIFPLIADARVSHVAARAETALADDLGPGPRPIVVQVPQEIAQARVRTRATDILLGRACAQAALQQAGAVSDHVGASPSRAPIWPDGWSGSLSHTGGIAWAAVARRTDFASLGIDIEHLLPADALESVRRLALTPDERRMECFENSDDSAWLTTVLFSAKESIFKCLNPLVEKFIDFTEMELSSVDLVAGRLRFTCRRRLAKWMDRGQRVDVWVARVGDLVLTATGWPSPPCHRIAEPFPG